jgi:hypothetical protein
MCDISKELTNDDDMRHLPSYAGVSITGTHRHALWIDVPGFLTVFLGPRRNASAAGGGHDVVQGVHPSPYEGHRRNAKMYGGNCRVDDRHIGQVLLGVVV